MPVALACGWQVEVVKGVCKLAVPLERLDECRGSCTVIVHTGQRLPWPRSQIWTTFHLNTGHLNLACNI